MGEREWEREREEGRERMREKNEYTFVHTQAN